MGKRYIAHVGIRDGPFWHVFCISREGRVDYLILGNGCYPVPQDEEVCPSSSGLGQCLWRANLEDFASYREMERVAREDLEKFFFRMLEVRP